MAGEMPHQPTTSNEGNGVYAQKASRIVMLHIRGEAPPGGPPIGANVTLCTLPKRFWPAKCVSAPYVVPSAAGYGTIGVAENGRIYGSASADAASSYYTCLYRLPLGLLGGLSHVRDRSGVPREAAPDALFRST